MKQKSTIASYYSVLLFQVFHVVHFECPSSVTPDIDTSSSSDSQTTENTVTEAVPDNKTVDIPEDIPSD